MRAALGVLSLAAMALFGSIGTDPASARQSDEFSDSSIPTTESGAPAILSTAVGELLVDAQNHLAERDCAGAQAGLNQAVDDAQTPYELGIALTLRGVTLSCLGDREGAVTDLQRALTEGDLMTTQRLSVETTLAQLQ